MTGQRSSARILSFRLAKEKSREDRRRMDEEEADLMRDPETAVCFRYRPLGKEPFVVPIRYIEGAPLAVVPMERCGGSPALGPGAFLVFDLDQGRWAAYETADWTEDGLEVEEVSCERAEAGAAELGFDDLPGYAARALVGYERGRFSSRGV